MIRGNGHPVRKATVVWIRPTPAGGPDTNLEGH
jgi:hypothetical protein